MKKNTIISLLIFSLFFLGSNNPTSSILIESGNERISVESSVRKKVLNFSSTEAISEAYISIDGNEDFSAQAALNSWPGDGSAGNPFIIADQEIETSNGIFISNTDVNFEIRNITIDSTFNLVNVKNGRIIDNVISMDRTFGWGAWGGAISLHNSSNNFIINNTIKAFLVDWRVILVRFNSGIVLDNCTNTLISENNASVILHESRKNSILNNNVYELELENSGNNTIINNNILINTPDTPGIADSYIDPRAPRYLKIKGNALNHYRQFVVENNTIGEKEILYYRDLNNQPILENLTHELAEVILVNCSSTSIRNKEFDVNSSETIPIRLNYCNDMIIDNCSRREHLDDIWGSNDIFIHQSQNITISNNNEMKIRLQSVFNSTILNNNGVSIYLQSNFSDSRIENNSIYTLSKVAYNWFDDDTYTVTIIDNVIKNNTFHDNNNPGIRLNDGNHFKRNILDCPISISGFQNVVSANNLTNLYLDENSEINYIYTNNFIPDDQGNSPAYDDGSNNIFIYNFWSDWSGEDENNDGYIDKPYLIDGTANNQDSYPSSVPFEHEYSHLLHLVTSPKVIFPNGREVISSSSEYEDRVPPIYISWVPAIDSHNHGVTYSVFYSFDAGISWKLIAQNLVEDNMEWDTRHLKSDNDYLIKVVATCTEGLTVSDTSDVPFTIFNLSSTTKSSTTKSSTTKPNVTPSFSMFNILVLLIIVGFIHRLRSRRLFLK